MNTIEDWFHYTACGLDNVWLANGYTVKKTKYGKGVSIIDIDDLHKLLATQLVEKNGLLSGREFRFLRVQLGLTQQGLGKLLGNISENAVSLWERNDSVPIVYDHWLRMHVIAKYKGDTKVVDAVKRIQTVERLVHQVYVVKSIGGMRRVEVLENQNVDLVEA